MATYTKCSGLGNEKIYLRSDGTFFNQLLGGCDGRVEVQGKWKINKDTLCFTEMESRMMDDPGKKSGHESKYLIKKGTMTAFSYVENKMVLHENVCFKKVCK